LNLIQFKHRIAFLGGWKEGCAVPWYLVLLVLVPSGADCRRSFPPR